MGSLRARIATFAVTAIVVFGCSGDEEPPPACSAASAWIPFAQEFYFESNDQDRPYETWRAAMVVDFNQMATLTLPPVSAAPSSELLPLLHRHNVDVEQYLSAVGTRQLSGIEPARLQMNDTIRQINGLLVAECDLAELTLYQPRRAADRTSLDHLLVPDARYSSRSEKTMPVASFG